MTGNSGTKNFDARWLVLVHQLPAKPAYARVKIWRRLQDTGAVSLKNSVYILPASEDARTQLASVLKDIKQHGGDGVLYQANLVAGMREDEIRALFNAARDADYHAISMELRQLAQAWKKAKKPKSDPVQALARISQRVSAVGRLDFFGAQGRKGAQALLSQLEHSGIARNDASDRPVSARPAKLTGKTWVTRQGIHVDRIACAWLIRRFVDPKAVLKFVPGKQYQPLPHELRYDMQDGEFTHEGDACSFEVLLRHTGLVDPALTTIAEMVHDMDLQDGKFGHAETAGIAHVISGICRTQGDDEARVARGAELFDDIHAQLRRGAKTRR
jgi:hypothetical protein